MPTSHAVTAHNEAIVAKALRYIKFVEDSLSDVLDAPQARYTVNYEGFGIGGTSGVTGDGASQFLRRLLSPSDPHARYRYRIEKVEIRFEVASASFTA